MGAVFTLTLTHLAPSAIAIRPRGPVRVSLAQRHMATSAVEEPNNTVGNSGAASDTLVQYVVLRRDLINTWPLGSVVTQGCHASVAAIWAHKDHPHTLDYCNPPNLDSMHKASPTFSFVLCECGIIFSLYEDLDEEEGENDPDIIPDELVSICGGDDEVQDLDFRALVSEPQPKKARVEEFVLGLGTSKAKEAPKKRKAPTRTGTSSSARSDTPH
ncbi:hypothetical protein RJ639_035456 [Escallonia herrerae]|uniref:peptidyl-tRNA hydrolase n=1 Tax=Escallonia herrerae TaxID=1293975 RepID=A0AA89B988_9ASTE|nr:hypothetical protein RJ639_035456 [Escallonia herrerae]